MQAPLDEADLTRIDELLADRLQHKIARRFEQARRCLAARYLPTYLLTDLLTCFPTHRPLASQADGCLAELRGDYGVFVNDKLKGWRADGGIFPTHNRVEGDGDASPAGTALDQARLHPCTLHPAVRTLPPAPRTLTLTLTPTLHPHP